MNEVYQINIIRKNNQTVTNISNETPLKEVYAMLYSAIHLVSEKTNQPVSSTLSVLADLDNFLKETGQI